MVPKRQGAQVVCIHCGRELEPDEKRKAIYPIPNGEHGMTDDNMLTGFSCLDCFPEVRAEQVRLGLVDDPNEREES